jgi:hypothetical protein
MAQDIFGRVPLQFAGAFVADGAVATFGGLAGGGVGLLCQQLSFNYSQSVTRLYEIGSNLAYYVVGRTQGSASASRVLGPRPVSTAFYRAYGNPCNNNTITFRAGVGCGPGAVGTGPGAGGSSSLTFVLTGVVLMSIAISVSAQDMIVNEQLQMMFIALLL